MIRLNNGFVAECLKTYRIFQEGRWDLLHPAWVWPYNAYLQNPFNHALILPLLAAAHIIGDLEIVLARLCCVSRTEFDSVFGDIMHCAEHEGKSFAVRNPFGEIYKSWKIRQKDLSEPDGEIRRSSLGFGTRLFLSLSSIPCLRQMAIRKMRNYAWNTAQIRKNLKKLP